MWALLLVGLVSSVAADSAVGGGVGGAGGSGVGVLPSSGAGHVAGDGHVVYDINAVRFEAAAAPSAAGDEALKIFCTCPDELAALPTMCDTVTHQCRQTFCSPVCLRMAWTPVIEVDCSLAPQWSWCSVFAEQVREAAAAVTAQFQAHVCLDRHFCNRTESLIDWIENANYGKHYPEHRLPIASCMQEDAPSGPAARADIHAALCTACERVLKVRLHMNSCIPANAQRGFETMQAGSLQERCLYVRDHIGVHEHDLLSEFRERVCPCLGCCGDKQCYFPNAEHAWLTNLIESVQHRVTSQLAGEGWLNHDGTAPDPRRPSSASASGKAGARAGAGAGAGTAKKGKRATKRPPTPTPTPTGARAAPNVAAQHP